MEAKIKKTCIALAAALSVLHASAIQKPNIIVIYADDVGRDHVVLQGVGIKAIRSGDWKYVPPGTVLSKGGIDEKILETIGEAGALYFLPEDPEELNNLAHVYPSKAMELKNLLEAELDATTVD